ncbi:MAG: ATP-binding protein [Candidatus Omnitrophota bacterium]|jgi:DNA helicase HerA-like ATPase|nr:MAG: ATP-binding protein [Candidatus Omnitrophota bacterium]
MVVNRENHSHNLGVITAGSLAEGLEMRLDPAYAVEQVRAGKFVVVEGSEFDFFSMITDVCLDASSGAILRDPPRRSSLLDDVLAGDHTYATISLKPMLMLQRGVAGERFDREEHLRPVKSIPVHFSTVREAGKDDVNRVFGEESVTQTRFFNLGAPLDMDNVEVCLDLDRFIERSNGIFGKTGTGKTFLTRLVLAGLIRSHKAVNLIFDMHSEYGWETRAESGPGKDAFVKGLKNLFPGKVLICTLDPDSARQRNVSFDLEVQIPLNEIEVEDIAPLQEELNLHPTAIETAYILRNLFKKNWLKKLLDTDPAEMKEQAEQWGANKESLAALYRKLRAVRDLPFVVDKTETKAEGEITLTASIRRIIEELRGGRHVDLEFGRVSGMLAYLLVANLISRRIHHEWVKDAEKYMATQKLEDRPRPLLITIEEAHKFLNPAAARQTIFGVIARELRKYFVSLLVVDQRPSGIDDEILSQLGTRITALLNDEKDIQAVFTGVSGASALRNVLATLDTKQQALILGHATPMPVVVKTRTYGLDFYRAMGWESKEEKSLRLGRITAGLPE